jgi:hypothetical protein
MAAFDSPGAGCSLDATPPRSSLQGVPQHSDVHTQDYHTAFEAPIEVVSLRCSPGSGGNGGDLRTQLVFPDADSNAPTPHFGCASSTLQEAAHGEQGVGDHGLCSVSVGSPLLTHSQTHPFQHLVDAAQAAANDPDVSPPLQELQATRKGADTAQAFTVDTYDFTDELLTLEDHSQATLFSPPLLVPCKAGDSEGASICMGPSEAASGVGSTLVCNGCSLLMTGKLLPRLSVVPGWACLSIHEFEPA